MASVNAVIEKLMETPGATVPDAGRQLLDILSGNQLGTADFLNDPLSLIGPPFLASRYLAQVTLRALKGEYDTLDEILASLHSVLGRGFGSSLRLSGSFGLLNFLMMTGDDRIKLVLKLAQNLNTLRGGHTIQQFGDRTICLHEKTPSNR
jgi:hypothetical protein